MNFGNVGQPIQVGGQRYGLTLGNVPSSQSVHVTVCRARKETTKNFPALFVGDKLASRVLARGGQGHANNSGLCTMHPTLRGSPFLRLKRMQVQATIPFRLEGARTIA